MICAAVERRAGIDGGKTFLAVCRMSGPLEGEPPVERKRLGTVRGELEKLRDLLKAAGVTHVAMESTGSYGKPVFKVPEEKRSGLSG